MTQHQKKFLVVGATGHVGSKVAIALEEMGCRVTALVRHHGTRINDAYNGQIEYVVGDLRDPPSMKAAVQGIDVVISTANGILPQKSGDNAGNVNANVSRPCGSIGPRHGGASDAGIAAGVARKCA